MPAPGPVAGRLETARRLVVGIATAARQSRLQRRRRSVVDVLPALNARPDRIRQHLREALHFRRGVRGINESSAFDDGLEFGHGSWRLQSPHGGAYAGERPTTFAASATYSDRKSTRLNS